MKTDNNKQIQDKREREKKMVSEMILLYCKKQHKSLRERIRKIMRFSGPRMLFVHPVAVIRHVIESRK